jgi:hypothetical protein
MNVNKLFVCVRSMEYMIKMKWSVGVGQDRFTNMNNVHTYTIGRTNLVTTIVPFVHGSFSSSPVMWSVPPSPELRYQLGSAVVEDAMTARQLSGTNSSSKRYQ